MFFLKRLFWNRVGKQINVYKLALKDKRTSFMVKLLLALGIGYLLIPVDFIPDFIPFLGQLDDSLILPILFIIAIFLIPKDVMEDSKATVNNKENSRQIDSKKAH